MATVGGQFVFTIRGPGGESTQVGCRTEDEAFELAQRLKVHGIRFPNPYSHAACEWVADYFELIDANDPDGKEGKALAILEKAFPASVGVER